MDEFIIKVRNKNFNFKKNNNGYYEITPFDEDIEIEELSNALIQEKGYYISGFGSYNPQPIKEMDEYGEIIHPFNIIEKCFFALIKPSRKNINNSDFKIKE